MSFDRVQKSASSTLASTENSAVSLQRKLGASSASPAPEISAQRSPMTTAQWLQSDLVMRTIQGFERKEAENSAPARSDKNASSVQLESLEQPESEAEEQVQTKAENSALARSDKNASSIQLESVEQPESDSEEQIQTKLTVGKPGDPYEQEADSMAAKVMTMPESAVQESIQSQTSPQTKASEPKSPTNSLARLVQRSATGEEEEIQMKSGMQRAFDGSIQASKSIESRLTDSQGGGSPLPQEVRGFMEPRFGADFGGVKVHTGSNAVQMNKELGAQAFARGSDIYYGSGKSPGNNELTAHELTHTIQQTGAKQLSAKSIVSLKSNKETFQTNSIAPPSLDSPAKTLPETEKSPPQTEKTTPSQPEQKAAPEAAPQPEKAENASAPEKQNAFGLFGQLGQITAIAGKLESVLSGAGGVIWSIVKDPVGFLGNLVSGLRQGFGNFYANVNTHLQTGLIGWLTGTLGPMGIQIPEDVFSFKGAFSMVTQVLGVTWDYIRSKAVKQFGERTVTRMEKSSSIFQMLAKGPMGLWEQASARFDDLKETTIEQIKNTIATQVIQAGLKWIMSLLNPASGLVKAAFAIYDIVMFFTQRASQMVELVQAATGAVQAVASGSVGGAASMVENALARSIPVAIGFMASLLGINGLATKVQEIVQKVRVKVDGAIDGVLLKAKNLSLKEKVKGNKDQSILDSKDDRDSQIAEQEDPEHNRKVTVGLEQLEQEQARYLDNNEISKEDAEKVAAKVRAENPVFKLITVADNKETWDYIYVASPAKNKPGAKKAKKNENNNILKVLEARYKHLLDRQNEFPPKIKNRIAELDSNIKRIRELQEQGKLNPAETEKQLAKIQEQLREIEDSEYGNLKQKEREALEQFEQLKGVKKTAGADSETAKQQNQATGDVKLHQKDLRQLREIQQARLKELFDSLGVEAPTNEELRGMAGYANGHKLRHTIIQDIVKHAGSWNEVKNKFVEYPSLMRQIIAERARVVDLTFRESMNDIARDPAEFTKDRNFPSKDEELIKELNKLLRTKEGKDRLKSVKLLPIGSKDLTSDYDATIVGKPEDGALEILAVIAFNQRFKARWGQESGTVFDTNVYTTGHMPASSLSRDGQEYSLLTSIKIAQGKIKDLQQKLQEIGDPEQTPANNAKQGRDTQQQIQREIREHNKDINAAISQINKLRKASGEEPLSVDEVLESLDGDLIGVKQTLKDKIQGEETFQNVGVSKAEKIKVAKNQEIMSLVKMRRFMTDAQWAEYTEAMRALGAETSRFEQADSIHKTLLGELDKRKSNLPGAVKDRENHASNRLYEEKLAELIPMLQELNKLRKQYEGEDVEKIPLADRFRINELNVEVNQTQSEALYFANEAYHTGGPVEHVVLNQQMRLDLDLKPQKLSLSINEQTGFIMEQTEHVSSNNPQAFGKSLWKSAKYLDRICDAAKKLDENQATTKMPDDESKKISQMRDAATELLKIKKNSVMAILRTVLE